MTWDMRRMWRKWCSILIAVAAGSASVGFAQEIPADLSAQRRLPAFPSSEREKTRTWIEAQVAKLFDADTPDIKAFTGTFAKEWTASDAGEPFRAALSEECAAVFAPRIKAAASAETKAAQKSSACMALMAVLNRQGRPAATEAYLAGLDHPGPAVRYLAAKGLRSIRGRLEVADRQQIVAKVRALGENESNAYVARLYFELIETDAADRREASAEAMIALLESRRPTLAKNYLINPGVAEVAAARWLGAHYASLPEGQTRTDVVTGVAKMLTQAVYAYLAGLERGRTYQTLEPLIEACERLLKVAAGGGNDLPNITTPMLKDDDARPKLMLLNLNKWVGTAQDAGVLNAAPWALPRGAGVERPAATRPSALAGGTGG